MPSLRIPTPLRAYTAGESEVTIQGQTAGDALNYLVIHHPGLKPHLFSEDGNLRPFVNLFLGEENISELQGLETPLKDDDRLLLIPSIAGGSAK
jgi:molybdopterin converting factor small subunit